ncbi:UreD urease accessory protein-domain-containing protein [Powellomyces hirtus]|nr:UreD urease accessory protein-domain-containing protein [Powellomyces hirtus]
MLTHPSPAGTGRITCTFRNSRTHLTEFSSTYPLRLLSPRSHSHSAAVYMLTYGGGILSGDQTQTTIAVGEHCTLTLLTQGSTKVFPKRKGADKAAGQIVEAVLEQGGLLAVLPDPTTLFAGATYVQKQVFKCAVGASLCLLDWYTAGRASRGEKWAFDSYETRNEVWFADRCVVRDAWLLQHDEHDAPGPPGKVKTYAARMGIYECFANVILVGPRMGASTARIQAAFDSIVITSSGSGTTSSTTTTSSSSAASVLPKDLIWSASPIPDCPDGIVVRAAALDTAGMRAFLADVLFRDLEGEIGERWFARV